MKVEQKEKSGNKAKDQLGDTNELSKRELECVTTVFKSFETGLREATILPRVRFHFVIQEDRTIVECKWCHEIEKLTNTQVF